MTQLYSRSVSLMGTIVTIKVVNGHESEWGETIERAFRWFRQVEGFCSRFDDQSEVMQLANAAGRAVEVSATLFHATRFAVELAKECDGAFDPTIGYAMESRGFNRNYRTSESFRSSIDVDKAVSYRDIELDPNKQTITLHRPLILDLGAVAKGLAIDLAACELRPFRNFMIDAGGDLYLSGHNPEGCPWLVGIRHPRHANELIDSVCVSDRAVCTSGDYERKSSSEDNIHHILDPRSGDSPIDTASVTVIAENAMLADASATAAFVLGPTKGLQFLDRLGAEGIFFSSSLERYATPGVCRG